MAKFTPEFNEELYRTVKSFNQRLRRAEARGLSHLPERQSVADLKARYSTVRDMKKELRQLRELNLNRDALNIVLTKGGARITKWEYDYIRKNLDHLKTFYDVMVKVGENRYKEHPYDTGLKQDLLNLQERRKYLDRDLKSLTQSEMQTFQRYMTKFKEYDKRQGNYYDLYMRDLDALVKNTGNTGAAKRIRDKINKLTPQEFQELIKIHDVMKDVFYLINSPPSSGKSEKNRSKTDEFYDNEDLNTSIKNIDDNLDDWISEVRAGLEDVNTEGLTEEELEVYYRYYGKR